MAVYQYCTPEWLEESARIYRSSPDLQKKLEKLTAKVCYLVKADPAWGIEKDIIFGSYIDKGEMVKLAFFSEEDARKKADFLLGATPQEWKSILRKERKFVTDFMTGKITLEHGSKVGALGLAPYANDAVNALTQVEIQFPDEMSPDELAEYRSHMEEFRAELGV